MRSNACGRKSLSTLLSVAFVATSVCALRAQEETPDVQAPPRLVAPVVGEQAVTEIGADVEAPSIPSPPATIQKASAGEAVAEQQAELSSPEATDDVSAPPSGEAASERQLKPGVQSVLSAYEKAQTAETLQEYADIIDLCAAARQAELSEKFATYARELSSWALNRRGELLAEQSHVERAAEAFRLAIVENTENWRAVHNLAVSQAQAGRRDDAIAGFARTIELNPKFVNAYFNRGELSYEAGEYKQAIEDYNEALKLAPKDAQIRNSRGHAYHQLGEFRRAVIDFTLAIKYDNGNAEAMANRGDVYLQLGFYKYAIHDFLQAIDTDPQLARAYQSAAWLMATCPKEEFRDAEGAVEAAITAIKLSGGQDPQDFDTLAAALANAGRFEQAQKAATKAIQLSPAGAEEPFAARLALYTQNQPYRSTPQPLDENPELRPDPAEIQQSSFEEPPHPDSVGQ
ncbi:MAG: tetratricopeptide repeat protein [Planctomycetales bacterium]|nr:tetratricopeptide repeat protein [Planctomycetales bacterium]